jgi:hypothetical protein
VPGPEAIYDDDGGRDLYPKDEASHQELITRLNQQFEAADRARQPFTDRWKKFYKIFRSYVQRKEGDWRSKVFIPVGFWIVQSIAPRLVAQLPTFLAYPVGPEDEDPAKAMEDLLKWASVQSHLFMELVKADFSALIYGTGILKTYHRHVERKKRIREPLQTAPEQLIPLIDPETGQPYRDPDGNPLQPQAPLAAESDLGYETKIVPYEQYDGPAAEAVDIFNFWPAPEAQDIDDARYVFQRAFRPMSWVLELKDKGVFRFPDFMSENDIWGEEEPEAERLASVELGAAQHQDPTRKVVEILEFWTDELVITYANRKAILRVQENPFDHGEKPFCRMVDQLVPHSFWGVGEIEPLEGLQNLLNAIVNQRVDNIRISMDKMYLLVKDAIQEVGQLKTRPGGFVEVDIGPAGSLEASIMPLELGDVGGDAFAEAEQIERFIEKVSGVTGYQQGTDAPSLNDTATGIALVQEAGATRFSFKTKLMELTGLSRLARHFGSIIQQFWNTERVVRLLGPTGEMYFQTFTPEAIAGALDYDIESESSTQTESLRKDSAGTLLQLLAGFFPPDPMTGLPNPGVVALLEDLLHAYGKKDIDRYLATLRQAAQLGTAGQLPPGMEGAVELGMGPEPTMQEVPA